MKGWGDSIPGRRRDSPEVGKGFLRMRNKRRLVELEDSNNFYNLTKELNYSETPNGFREKSTKS